MKIGVNTSVNSDSYDVAALAKRAEELGFESFFLPEHTIMPVNVNTRYHGSEDGSIPDYMTYMADPLVALSRASAVTSEIKLGTGVLLVPEHNPVLLAKEIATLDHFSGGRFLFGIGSGWLREETEIMGGDFDHRWTQTKDAILAMKELWTKDEAEYQREVLQLPSGEVQSQARVQASPSGDIGRICQERLQTGCGLRRRVDAHQGDPRRHTPGPGYD